MIGHDRNGLVGRDRKRLFGWPCIVSSSVGRDQQWIGRSGVDGLMFDRRSGCDWACDEIGVGTAWLWMERMESLKMM